MFWVIISMKNDGCFFFDSQKSDPKFNLTKYVGYYESLPTTNFLL